MPFDKISFVLCYQKCACHKSYLTLTIVPHCLISPLRLCFDLIQIHFLIFHPQEQNDTYKKLYTW